MGHTPSRQKSKIEVRRRGETHKDRCNTGYYKNVSGEFTQIHHILCVSCLSDARISDKVQDKGKMQFIRECLKLTNWNINDSHNTVGLPKKQAYLLTHAPGGWDKLPCHQVDHNPLYTERVSTVLYDNVWVEVLSLRKRCENCDKECVIKAKDVEQELKDESKEWLRLLKERGNKHKGTAYCWEHREDNDKMKKIWYIPFSMAFPPDDIPERKPPKDWNKLAKSLKNYMSNIMFS